MVENFAIITQHPLPLAESSAAQSCPVSRGYNNDTTDAMNLAAGDIRFAEIQMKDGRSNGCGSVRFHSPEGARRAVSILWGRRTRQGAITFQV